LLARPCGPSRFRFPPPDLNTTSPRRARTNDGARPPKADAAVPAGPKNCGDVTAYLNLTAWALWGRLACWRSNRHFWLSPVELEKNDERDYSWAVLLLLLLCTGTHETSGCVLSLLLACCLQRP